MAFWTGGGAASVPRRDFRFLVNMDNIPVWVAKAVTLPTINVSDAAKVQFLNHEFKFPGTVKYTDVTVTLLDAVDQDISLKVLEYLTQGGYQTPDNIGGAGSDEINLDTAKGTVLFKNEMVTNLSITQLGAPAPLAEGASGPATGAIERDLEYIFENAFAKSVQFPQSLSYASENVSDIKITFAFDYFKVRQAAGTVPPGFEAS